MGELLLVGAGGHSKAIIDVIEREDRWRIVGVVDHALAEGSDFCGYPVLGGDAALPKLRRQVDHALVAVGQIRTPAIRQRLYEQLLTLGFRLPSIVSSRAEVSRRATIGAGTVVMHFAAVGPEAAIGCNSIVNTRALIEHDGRVGDHCHISTGSILNGSVTVENGSFVGSGSIIREGLTIGAGSFVGMASRLIHSLPAATIYKESPR